MAPQPVATIGAGSAAGVVVLKLAKPITTHQGSVSELRFRPITAATLFRLRKLPFGVIQNADGSRKEDYDFNLLAEYVAELTGVDTAILGQLTMSDLMQCMVTIASMVNNPGN